MQTMNIPTQLNQVDGKIYTWIVKVSHCTKIYIFFLEQNIENFIDTDFYLHLKFIIYLLVYSSLCLRYAHIQQIINIY